MNLKYYLRGLGLGIIVTAVIMSIIGVKKENLSNDEIKARAKELGMIDNTVLSEYKKEETDVSEDNTGQDVKSGVEQGAEPEILPAEEMMPVEPDTNSESDGQTTKPEQLTDNGQTTVPKPSADNTQTTKSEPITGAEQTDTEMQTADTGQADEIKKDIVITIKSGEGSYKICKQLESAGLINSASSFDTYLVQNGYDKQLVASEYSIPTGSSEDEIAQIITGR